MSNSKKILFISIIIAITVLISGNFFWIAFSNSLKLGNLLTNSFIKIVLSLLLPIILLALYFSSLAYFSIFVKKRTLWVGSIVLSLITYPSLSRDIFLDVIGGIVIGASLYGFILSFHRLKVLVNDKASFIGKLSLSLTLTGLIITFIITLNFYDSYRNSLSRNNILIPDKVLRSYILPIYNLYIDELKIKNTEETLEKYVQRNAYLNRTSQNFIKEQTLTKLNLKNAEENETMGSLVQRSLSSSFMGLIRQYRNQIPILVSFGLIITTNTMINAGILTAGILSFLLLKFFYLLKIVKTRDENIKIEIVESI